MHCRELIACGAWTNSSQDGGHLQEKGGGRKAKVILAKFESN
jgi:hypothetical protein